MKQLRNYKKNMGSSEDPRLVNNVDDLGLVYYGLSEYAKAPKSGSQVIKKRETDKFPHQRVKNTGK